jgi:hypothetical protein
MQNPKGPNTHTHNNVKTLNASPCKACCILSMRIPNGVQHLLPVPCRHHKVQTDTTQRQDLQRLCLQSMLHPQHAHRKRRAALTNCSMPASQGPNTHTQNNVRTLYTSPCKACCILSMRIPNGVQHLPSDQCRHHKVQIHTHTKQRQESHPLSLQGMLHPEHAHRKQRAELTSCSIPA